jgi:hypothetical protein
VQFGNKGVWVYVEFIQSVADRVREWRRRADEVRCVLGCSHKAGLESVGPGQAGGGVDEMGVLVIQGLGLRRCRYSRLSKRSQDCSIQRHRYPLPIMYISKILGLFAARSYRETIGSAVDGNRKGNIPSERVVSDSRWSIQ